MSDSSNAMGLTRWTSLEDPYDSGQLAQNFLLIATHDHSTGKGVQITSNGIATDAITSVKILDKAVSSTKLAYDVSVDANRAVTTDHIKNSAITSAKIQDLTIQNGDIAEGTIANSKLANSSIQIGSTSLSLGDVASSLVSNLTGNVTGNVSGSAGNAPAGTLTGTTIASNIVNSSLTKVGLTSSGYVKTNSSGTLSSSSTVAGADISGNITGAAGSVPASGVTGTTLASNVVNSSIQNLGTQNANLNMGGKSITNLPSSPSASTDAASKAYVDQQSVGLSKKDAVQAATTGNITSFPPTGTQTIDGISVTITSGSGGIPARVLVKDQTTASQNGIWVVGSPWTRATDMDTWSEVINAYVLVLAGNTNAATGWAADAAPGSTGTVGSTAISFKQFSASITLTAGNGIDVSGQTISLKSATAGTGLTYTSGVLSVNASQSQITSLGTLGSLTVTDAVTAGSFNGLVNIGTSQFNLNRSSAAQTLNGVSIDGSAGSVAASGITGTTLASNVLYSSLTKVGLSTAGYVKTDASGNITSSSTVSGTDVSGNISGSAGSVANALTIGSGLALDSGTTYNGSAGRTLSLGSSVVTTTGSQDLSNKTVILRANTGTVASLQFTPTSATLLSTPTAGALEVGSDGTLYYTKTSGAGNRKTVAFTDTTISNSQLSGSGTIGLGSSSVTLGNSVGTSSLPITGFYLNTPTLTTPTISGTITASGLSTGVVKSTSGTLSSSAITNSDIANATSGTGITRAQLNSTTSGLYVLPQYVTSLSGTWNDGDEVYYLADATNRVLWHLRYNASSSSSYKWEYIGGPPVTKDTTTFGGGSNWVLSSGVSPAIPLAGDYDLSVSLGIYASRSITTSAGNVGATASLVWPTKITQTINSSATSVTINNPSAAPKSGTNSTVAAIEVAGNASYEVVTVSNRASSTLTIGRAASGTTAASHTSGAPIFILPNPDAAYVEQTGLSALVVQVTGPASTSAVWGGGSRTYRFTGLEASTTQVPELFAKATAGADNGFTLQNIQVTLRPVRVG
jgi:hypothetical protein